MKGFEKICKMSQPKLKAYLEKSLKSNGYEVVSSDGFIYAKGTFPVMLVAHMDTVHKESVKFIVYAKNKDMISSPQGIGGDDRCGVYMILNIIQHYKCSVLFTEDEEIGGVGTKKFLAEYRAKTIDVEPVNYLIELDRKGSSDAVFYDCDNPEFTEFILKDDDWTLDFGTYTDICDIAPAFGVAAVNFSCGYYNAHTIKEYVVRSEMEANIEKVEKLLDRTTQDDWFEYIEAEPYYGGFYGNWETSVRNFSDYDDYNTYYICAVGEGGEYIEREIDAMSQIEAVGAFLVEYPDLCFHDILDIIHE